MLSFLQNVEFSPLAVFSISIVLAAALLVEIGYTVLAKSNGGRSRINRRMKASEKHSGDQHALLVQLRKERGLDSDGHLVLSIKWINLLIVQAGLTIGIKKFFMFHLAFVLATSLAILVLTKSLPSLLCSIPITAIILPIVWLKRRRSKKLLKFGKQLPEAIELVTRSLKAGHPVPVAMSMVAREMQDPIGTEFGMVVDEVTYGSDLVTGLLSMYDRVGHPDLPLLVSAVSIQSTTGGNLREILEGLSAVIRERLKMKAKIRAISSEGRMSATFLSALPFVLFLVLLLITPNYYGGIWDTDLTFYLMGVLLFWLVCGNLMILKMCSFKV